MGQQAGLTVRSVHISASSGSATHFSAKLAEAIGVVVVRVFVKKSQKTKAPNSVSGFSVVWGTKGVWGTKAVWGTSGTQADKAVWGTDASTSESDTDFEAR